MKFLRRFTALVCVLLVFTMAAPVIFSAASPIVTTAEAAAKPKLNKKKITLLKGESYTLKVLNTKKKVKWASSDPSIVKVKKGKITAKKPGTAVITATVGSKVLTCKVKVTGRILSNHSSLVMQRGSSKSLRITVKPKNKYANYEVFYYNDDTNVIDCYWVGEFVENKATLFVKAVGSGTATITLTWSLGSDILEIPVVVN